ncbi:hypothetical protein [Bacillus solitudinis]|uniref:hypothetical protein n=1 Tax=Bacillus solitudinis TaxID=2014074 RepID=UPI000C2340DF|nr:hypothetical protein [Bacillus solitudinis]
MKLEEKELKAALQQFENLIIELPDKRESIPEFKSFITAFLRTKTTAISLPIGDVMAIIKHKKPLVFSVMRSEYSKNIMINVVTHMDIEYSHAYRRLNELRRLLGIIKRF